LKWLPPVGRKRGICKEYKIESEDDFFEIKISVPGSWNKPHFYRKITGIYEVYSHYATNNKAPILALVKNPLFA
jgi:hypothetical protein